MTRRKRTQADAQQGIIALGFIILFLIGLKNPGALWALVILGVVMVGVVVVIQRRARARFFQEQDTLEKLRRLTPGQFEEYVVDLFQQLGYKMERVGGSYDGGIDVIATKGGVKHFIQCKKFITRQVTVHDVRDFYGAIVDDHSMARAFFITTNIFTLEAEKFCEDKPIELIDGQKLMGYVRQAGVAVPIINQAETERCPRDGGVIVKREGKFGPFLGCSNYPRCAYTKSLEVNNKE
ncbi:MAG: restriction endonuclease [bacterium]